MDVVKGSVRLLSPPHIPFFPSKLPVFLFAASDFLDGAAVTGTLGVVCVVGGFLFKLDEARTIGGLSDEQRLNLYDGGSFQAVPAEILFILGVILCVVSLIFLVSLRRAVK